MPIENRNLEPGTKLVARHKKQTYSTDVIAGADGKLRYRLVDGREFKSPSSAGTAITGKACNGWAFWSLANPEQQEAPANKPEDEHQEAPSPDDGSQESVDPSLGTATEQLSANGQGPAKRRIFKAPNQRGLEENQVRWYCHDCGGSFLVAEGQKPGECPKGHPAS